MKKNKLKNSFNCKYSKYQSRNVECPAEHSLKFINTILNKLEDKNYKELTDPENGFGKTLQREIQRLYPNTEIFWSLGREKEDVEQQASIHEIQYDIEAPWIGNLIRSLNEDYHSEHFLHNLVKHTKIAQANFFTIKTDGFGIKLISYCRDELYESDKDTELCFKTALTPKEFYKKIKDKWKKQYTETCQKKIKEEIREYLEKWANAVDSKLLSKIPWKTTNITDDTFQKNKQHTLSTCYDAIKHFALMSLYMCYKDSQYVTYFLSPTIQEKFDSSLVIYWGKIGIPDRPFLYLLSMLLGLNHAPVLQNRTQSELRQIAFRNTGHVLKNRCNSISGYLAEIEKDRLLKDDQNKFESAQNLSGELVELFDILWLWSYDNVESALTDLENDPEKRKRYFADDDCNLLDVIFPLCDVTAESRELDGIQKLLHLKINATSINDFILMPKMSKEGIEKKYRLSNKALGVIFYEIMLNAVRHGYINNSENPNVTLNITKRNVNGKNCICFWNRVNVESKTYKEKYEELPLAWEAISHDNTKGLGIAAKLLDNFSFGSIWHGRYGEDCYAVAVNIKGLKILDNKEK